MKQQRYDIFISYRRDGGAQYARTLQLMLEKRGYRVFLDYDELVDEMFSPQIEAAIKNSTIYLILLTKGSMIRCANEGDWVRREIEIAIDSGKRIIPVNPDGTYDGMPSNVPQPIKSVIENTQHSEVNFGQTLNATVDQMIKNRIRPYVHHFSWLKWVTIVLAISAFAGFFFWQQYKSTRALEELEAIKQDITFQGKSFSWPEDINKGQLLAIKEILGNMQLIDGGEFMQGAQPLSDGSYHENVEVEFETPAHKQEVASFYMSKYEVTIGQWNAIMNDDREGDPNMPISSLSLNEAKAFADSLFNLTNIEFRLPTETEWEYAAKGGCEAEGYMYAGSDNPDDVAWYCKNSDGKCQSGLRSVATVNDLFNMSGNLSEWCDSKFIPYDPNIHINNADAAVIRGGNYDSEEYEITNTHREPALPDTSIPTLGFRIVFSK